MEEEPLGGRCYVLSRATLLTQGRRPGEAPALDTLPLSIGQASSHGRPGYTYGPSAAEVALFVPRLP